MINIEMRDFVNELALDKVNNMPNNTTYIDTTKYTYVMSGKAIALDEDYCRENNIEILRIGTMGGAIVNFVGDVNVANFQEDYYDYGKNFVLKLRDYLRSKGLNAEYTSNDLVIDGVYKCLGLSSTRLGNKIYTAIHISMNVDVDLINRISTKTMVKIPKGLTEYGITTEEIIEFINREIEQ